MILFHIFLWSLFNGLISVVCCQFFFSVDILNQRERTRISSVNLKIVHFFECVKFKEKTCSTQFNSSIDLDLNFTNKTFIDFNRCACVNQKKNSRREKNHFKNTRGCCVTNITKCHEPFKQLILWDGLGIVFFFYFASRPFSLCDSNNSNNQ